jgi:hypothetical protein
MEAATIENRHMFIITDNNKVGVFIPGIGRYPVLKC